MKTTITLIYITTFLHVYTSILIKQQQPLKKMKVL